MPQRQRRNSRRRQPYQDSDYDGCWKEYLRLRLAEFIRAYFPAVAVLIDWSVAPVWLDKEIGQVIGRSRQRGRSVDQLVKLRLLDGSDRWLLVHVEIQTSPEEEFTRRLMLYNAGILTAFREEVVTLAVLADLKPDWLPSEYCFELGGFRRQCVFPICKLVTKLEQDWAGDTSLPVQLARAQIAALRTAGDPEGRYQAKWQLVRNLYTAGYNAEELRETFHLLDWMLRLGGDWEETFKQQLLTFEEEQHMPYVTSIERLARDEGLDQGREEGQLSILLPLLRGRIGKFSKSLENRLRELSADGRQQLAREVFDLDSAAALKAWLDQIAESNGD